MLEQSNEPWVDTMSERSYFGSISHSWLLVGNHSDNARKKEGNVLFNDTLSTFYLRLYGIRHMVKNHSERERKNLLLPHRLLFLISSKGYFICISQTHTTAFVTPVRGHQLEWELAQLGPIGSPWRTMSERSYHGAISRSIMRGNPLAHFMEKLKQDSF